jgi:hypothetical protein
MISQLETILSHKSSLTPAKSCIDLTPYDRVGEVAALARRELLAGEVIPEYNWNQTTC